MTEHMTLNVTHNGISQNLAQPVESVVTDDDIRRIAEETLNLPGAFVFFVVDRFPDTGMIYLRPKVPFG